MSFFLFLHSLAANHQESQWTTIAISNYHFGVYDHQQSLKISFKTKGVMKGICYAQACTIINGASLKNKNDFLITPRRRAGSSKKYIMERHLENKMLKYWCDWWKTISDCSRALRELLRKGITSQRAKQSHERPEGLTLRTVHGISLSLIWDCKEQISLEHEQRSRC